ncbi:MAG: transcriptional regulator NrdR [Actinomycetota bacterium]
MRCPYCELDHDKVVDSRPSDEGSAVRRRRECLECGRRFTTYERHEELPVLVRKRSGLVEPYDREKLLAGIKRAIAGRAVAEGAAEAIADDIDERVRAEGREVGSEFLGLAVLERLRALDPVSYLRFASVYKGFEDVGDFEREFIELQKTTAPKRRP